MSILANIRGLMNFVTDKKVEARKESTRSNSCPVTSTRKETKKPPLRKQETYPNFGNPIIMYDA